jgi:hypothetical protein
VADAERRQGHADEEADQEQDERPPTTERHRIHGLVVKI